MKKLEPETESLFSYRRFVTYLGVVSIALAAVGLYGLFTEKVLQAWLGIVSSIAVAIGTLSYMVHREREAHHATRNQLEESLYRQRDEFTRTMTNLNRELAAERAKNAAPPPTSAQ